MESSNVFDTEVGPNQLDGFSMTEAELSSYLSQTPSFDFAFAQGVWQLEAQHNSSIVDNAWSVNRLACPPIPDAPGLGLTTTRQRSNVEQIDQATSPPTSQESSLKGCSTFQPRKCQQVGCPEKRVFIQSSAFKKHMDKHIRPFECPITTCNVNNFATSGDLKRHEREVHTAPSYLCPITSCKRHRKGFSRKDNLAQHMRRTHETSTPMPWEQAGQPSTSAESMTSGDGSGEVLSNSSDKSSLMAKLQELESGKMEAIKRFDGDIEALKRVLAIM